MQININIDVKVKLTDYGIYIFKKHWKDYGIDKDIKYKDGYALFHLWELMNIFGSVLYMGNTEIPFESNDIIFDDKDITDRV